MSKTTKTDEELLANIRRRGQETAKAYNAFIHAVDTLSNAMDHDSSWVLGQLLPRTKNQRRDGSRIMKWLAEQESTALLFIRDNEKQAEIHEKREAILNRIKLTPEEMKILNIKQP